MCFLENKEFETLMKNGKIQEVLPMESYDCVV